MNMNQKYCNGIIHVIKKGESLYQLSRMYRVPLALILRANPYLDVYNLQPGQEICVPVSRKKTMHGMPPGPGGGRPMPPGPGNMPTPPGPGNMPTPPGAGNMPTPPGSGNMPTPPGPGNMSTPPGSENVPMPRGQESMSTMQGVESTPLVAGVEETGRKDGEEPAVRMEAAVEHGANIREKVDKKETYRACYVADGVKSLGEILRETKMSLNDLEENNDLEQIIVGADVTIYLPNKV